MSSERIDEILWLQKKHHDIIDNNPNPPVQQTSLAELHRLNITLSNYFDVAPDIIGHHTSVIRKQDSNNRSKNHPLINPNYLANP